MKKSLFLILLCMLMLFVGCEKKDPNARQRLANTRTAKDVDKQEGTKENKQEKENLIEDNLDYGEIVCEWDKNYKRTDLDCSKIHITKPFGVCVFNEQVVVSDKEENKLVILDENLNFVKEIKTFAPDEEELFEPTGMTVFEDKLYLLDAGNNRILILDFEFVIQDSIELLFFAEHAGGVRYIDIAIDKEGIIYVCTDSVRESKYVYVIENGEIQKTERAFYGHLAERDGEVYALDTFELGVNGEGSSLGQAGVNYLYHMNKTKMESVKEMPCKFAPLDFVFTNDKMVTISKLFSKVYRFSVDDFEAEKEIAALNGEKFWDLNMAALNDTDFLITNEIDNKMYYIHYQEE